MNKIISKALYLIFGDWNGIQNFFAPTVLLFLFNQYSFINWITAMLTYQRYFIPLFVYVIVVFSILFLCIKVLVQWHTENKQSKLPTKVNVLNELMFPFVIKLHKWLFAFSTIFMIIFVIKSGYVFIYRVDFPLFTVYYWILRIGGIVLTLYVFALLEIALPIIRRGRSLNQAQKYFHLLIIKRWKHTLPILIVQLLWVYVSVLIFTLAINQLLNLNDFGFFQTNGKPIEISFQHVHTLRQFWGNTSIMLGAFMISNLLYSPLMFLVNLGFHRLKLTLKNI